MKLVLKTEKTCLGLKSTMIIKTELSKLKFIQKTETAYERLKSTLKVEPLYSEIKSTQKMKTVCRQVLNSTLKIETACQLWKWRRCVSDCSLNADRSSELKSTLKCSGMKSTLKIKTMYQGLIVENGKRAFEIDVYPEKEDNVSRTVVWMGTAVRNRNVLRRWIQRVKGFSLPWKWKQNV